MPIKLPVAARSSRLEEMDLLPEIFGRQFRGCMRPSLPRWGLDRRRELCWPSPPRTAACAVLLPARYAAF